ncbi:AraC family transcriptional regulator [Lysobacter pythonis]|uniref:AraC family transcriptional regulator n=1 Tax=Solilutibacter pythonis TaxID=2483112 RepID=A0A3M2I8Q2_9GAMM|nr:AraC family transcriptional regulator [Lysobacter pythonis]RMH94857.1 AraC family transcriptional regulator [Lysobacter pythonis]
MFSGKHEPNNGDQTMGNESKTQRPAGAPNLPSPLHYRAHARSVIEYALNETSLPLIDDIEILHSSEGHGWSDMAAAITRETPHVAEHRPTACIWITTVLTPRTIRRKVAGQTLAGTLEPHTLVMTPPGESVVDAIGNTPRTLHFFLKDSVLQEVAENIYDLGTMNFRYKAAFAAADPTLSHLMLATKQMLLEGLEGNWRSEYIARAVASHILHRYCVLGGNEPAHANARLSPSQLKKVDEFMRHSLARQFTFSELAAAVGLSRTVLFQRFTRTLRQTPHQYRQSMRVTQAKALIKQGGMTLAEVATACGFSDQTHMTRAFRQVLGMTPGQYRRCLK